MTPLWLWLLSEPYINFCISAPIFECPPTLVKNSTDLLVYFNISSQHGGYPNCHWIGTILVELVLFVDRTRNEDFYNLIEHRYQIVLNLHSSFVQCNSKTIMVFIEDTTMCWRHCILESRILSTGINVDDN